MNFFQSQDNARRRTGWLVAAFCLAVACLIGITQLLVMVLLRYSSNTALTLQGNFWSAFSWNTLASIAAGITAVVVVASFYKIQQLRTGGSAVAVLLGGQLLDRASTQANERKILNVVEEMAIASGVSVPPVYLLEEAAINAFAAGHDSRDVVIGITRGAIELLSRDELQGVIAHEFSHIFNGDMRINLQLIGWLHGILFIGLIGRFLLENHNNHSYSSRNNRGAGLLLLLGLGLVIIGYSGTFFGKLIKAAISRQREFLADASAVQYTRNPEGIAGALKKIGGCPLGSSIAHPNVAQISHLFFGEGLRNRFAWFSTHPPLAERIQAVEPRWDGDFISIDINEIHIEKPKIDPAHVNIINGEIQYTPPRNATAFITAASVTTALDAIGAPTTEHIAKARQTIDSIPDHLQKLARESWGASAIVHCLLAADQPENQTEHLALLQKNTVGSIHSLCEKIANEVQQLPIILRLPLIDLCLPSLKQLSTVQRIQFLKTVVTQIRVDQTVSLFEWALYRLLRHHLDGGNTANTTLSLAAAEASCATVLSALALATHSEPTDAQKHFDTGWKVLGLPNGKFDANVLDNMASLDQAVRGLHHLQALSKPRLLKACCAAITVDGHYTIESVELLRAIADTIDTPIPPIVTTVKHTI